METQIRSRMRPEVSGRSDGQSEREEVISMGCRKRKNPRRKNKNCRMISAGMILIIAGVLILSLFVLPHRALIILTAIALIAAGCFLA